jgi:excisionase family DNA binding protein
VTIHAGEIAMNAPEKLYRVRDVAKILGQHEFTIRRKMWSGEIKAIKLSPRCVRVRASALDAYLKSKPLVAG